MPVLSAENSYKKGLAALVEGRDFEAVDFFRHALRIEKEHRVLASDARYLSYYGLSLSRAHGPGPEALRSCEDAVRRRPQDPTLLLNLGRVYGDAGRTSRALRCFETALALSPAHAALRREMTRFDRRGAPVIGLLDRSNPLNRWLGRWRARRRTALVEPTRRATPAVNRD